ncbi:hypothetical protein AMECASPLE_017338 [Ameca splendens]|uniref:Uncharacterized protein n=1 Tax=Ameca splendens TaxID=208324 RepID=A0ABV0YDZ6_9TELE
MVTSSSELLIRSAYAEDPDCLRKRTSRIIFSVGCILVSSLLRLPVNEPGSPSTVLSSKIIHLVPPPPQVQTELPGPFTYPTRSRSFPSSHFSSPWRIS